MIRRTLSQVAQMIGSAELLNFSSHLIIEGVSIDTRTIRAGNLFVPIVGERFNGHAFVQAALDSGAAAALWQKEEPNPPDVPLILVDDTLAALQQLAKAYREQLRTQVVAITGSNGKTSTKDILAGILSTAFKTQKTNGNLNNHLGVPLTLLSLEEDTEMAVVEMGMSGLGEIELLSSLASPEAAIITNVSEVHLGDLHTRERIAEAKLEIVSGLKKGGLFALNGDNPLLLETLTQSRRNTADVQIKTFGMLPSNMLHPVDYTLDETGVRFGIADEMQRTSSESFLVPLLGKHQMINALGAIAIARHYDLSDEQIRQGLLQIDPTGMRNERIQTSRYTIINDAYKSNPSSLRAALETLAALDAYERKIAVIGDMVELGDEVEQMHREIGEQLKPEEIDVVVTLGPMAAELAQAAAQNFPEGRVIACIEKQQVIDALRNIDLEGSAILVKGSRALQLEDIVKALQYEVNA